MRQESEDSKRLIDRNSALHAEELGSYKREMQSSYEQVLVSRATLEDSQRRMFEITKQYSKDMFERDESSKRVVSALHERILESEIAKGDIGRRSNKVETERDLLKRRFEEVAGYEQEVKRLRIGVRESESKASKMSVELERMTTKCSQLVEERERQARSKLQDEKE